MGTTQNWMMRSGMRSPQYTTRWNDLLVLEWGGSFRSRDYFPLCTERWKCFNFV